MSCSSSVVSMQSDAYDPQPRSPTSHTFTCFMWAARKSRGPPPSVTVGSSRLWTHLGHSSGAVMTEGGSRDDPGWVTAGWA